MPTPCAPPSRPTAATTDRSTVISRWRADGGGIAFHLGHGDWLRLLRGSGFEVLDLLELQAPPGAQAHPYYDAVPVAWARRWPAEEVWKLRRA